MENQSLYQLSHEITDLMSRREKSQEDDQERGDGNISMDFEGSLGKLFDKFQDKVENVCKFIRNLEVSSLGLEDEMKRIQTLKRQNDNKVDRLKSYLSMILKAQGLEKYDAGLFKLSLRPSERMKIIGDAIPYLPSDLKKHIFTVVAQDEDEIEELRHNEWGLVEDIQIVGLPEIKKRYKSLDQEDKQKLKDIVYIENVQSLQLK